MPVAALVHDPGGAARRGARGVGRGRRAAGRRERAHAGRDRGARPRGRRARAAGSSRPATMSAGASRERAARPAPSSSSATISDGWRRSPRGRDGETRDRAAPAVGRARRRPRRSRAVRAGHPPARADRRRASRAALAELAARSAGSRSRSTRRRAALPAPQEAAAFFVCSEGLANVAKYAGRDACGIDVAATDGRLVVRVADDGPGGADADARLRPARTGRPRRGAGRALEVDSPPGAGTRLRAELPIARRRAGDLRGSPRRSLHGLAAGRCRCWGVVARCSTSCSRGDGGDRAQRAASRARRRLGPALARRAGRRTLLLAAALATWRPPVPARYAPLLIAAALAWLAAEWNTPAAGVAVHAPAWCSTPPGRRCSPRPRCAGWTSGHSDRPAVAWSALRVRDGVGVLGLGSAAVFDPAAQGCAAVPGQSAARDGAPGAWHDLGQAGLALSAAWAAGFAVARRAAVVARVAGAPPARTPRCCVPAVARRGAVRRPTRLHGLERGFLSNDPTDRALRLAQAGALVAGRRRGRARAPARRGARARRSPGSCSTSALRPRRADCARGSPRRSATRRSSSCTPSTAAAGSTPAGARVSRRTAASARSRACAPAGRDVLAVVHRRGLLDDPALVAELADDGAARDRARAPARRAPRAA